MEGLMMSDKMQPYNGSYENKTKTFKNINQSATNYVQQAIENYTGSTQDATQNLVNDIMRKRKK
jgi:D-alanyl-D-alanine carboxypeptidase